MTPGEPLKSRPWVLRQYLTKCSPCKHFRALSMPALQREAASAKERFLGHLCQSVPQNGCVIVEGFKRGILFLRRRGESQQSRGLRIQVAVVKLPLISRDEECSSPWEGSKTKSRSGESTCNPCSRDFIQCWDWGPVGTEFLCRVPIVNSGRIAAPTVRVLRFKRLSKVVLFVLLVSSSIL